MRFVYINKKEAEGSHLTKSDSDPHLVMDTEPPEGDAGQCCLIGLFPNKAAAKMATMALNGVPPVKDSSN